MKNLSRLCLLVSTLALVCAGSAAAAESFFSLSNTGTASAPASVVTPAVINRTPRLEYLHAISDDAAAAVVFYTLGDDVSATQNQDSISNLVSVSSVAGFASNDVVVATAVGGASYRFVLLDTANTKLKITGTFGFTVTTQTKFRKATPAGRWTIGTDPLVINGNPWNGQIDLPLLLDVTGGVTNSINAASGSYAR